jgi:ribonuclease T2
MHRNLFRIAALVALASMATIVLQGRPKKAKAKKPPAFAYYMLVLSYAPDFCDQKNVDKDPRECGVGSHAGFVVHGLWPQGENSRGPEDCGSAGTIPAATITEMLKYFPTESLMKHEWAAHGTCSGLSMDDYFAAVKKTRDSVKIPDALVLTTQQSLAPGDIENKVASANASFPRTSFRTSCYSADKELEEVRICLNKDLSPRACGSSAGECSIKSLKLLPVH